MAEANHYVDNKKFYTEMVKFINRINEVRDKGLPKEKYPRIPDYIGDCIYKIATRLSYSKNFIGYSYREEMIGDAIENCLTYIHNFNPDKSKNPFAYFTQISYYAFLRRIHKEQKHQYIKQKSAIEMSTVGITSQVFDDSNVNGSMNIDMDKYRDYVEKFEKPKKKKAKKGAIENFVELEDTPDE